MSDFVICDGSPISVQRIIDKKFDEDVDVCEKTAYIEKKAAEEKFQKELEKIKDEYLKKCKEAEDEYKKECKVIGERYKKIIQQLYETATGKKNEENLEKDEQNFSMTIRQCLFRRWAEVNEIEIPADLNNKIKIKDVLDEIGEDREENDIIKEFRRNLYSNIDTIMGDIEIDGKRIRAHEALTAGKKKSKLTIDNYVFFKSVLLDGDIEAGNNIIEIIDENRSLELDDREKDIIRYTQYKKDEKAYRTQFNNFFRGFVDPTYEIPEVSCGWITIHNKMGTVYSSTINEYAAKIQNYANGTSNHESWYGSIYVDANGGYREYVVVETDGTLSFPEQGDYDLIYLNTGKTAGVQDSKGFEKDVPLYYLLGDYDSDYDKYTDLEGAAEAMKEYPHEVYLMTIDTGYAA